ncbi:LOW QUALITY PROTEIN: amine oxidase [Elysia marginata]|uniref:Amine oxidase n=1 Tax=Elysia marginata TaxID=1093978 RepID=A0AAV4GVX1_9GAST|nr:LOW QUALITY PROTEIN: amine oxidase [Elysia marginata]
MLKTTEQEALHSYDEEVPKYHIVHNDKVKNSWGEKKAYRIHLYGTSKNLIPDDFYVNPAKSWARTQIAVSKRKESEFLSIANYAMYDRKSPVMQILL